MKRGEMTSLSTEMLALIRQGAMLQAMTAERYEETRPAFMLPMPTYYEAEYELKT